MPASPIWTDANALNLLIAGTVRENPPRHEPQGLSPDPEWDPNAPRTVLILATRFPPDASVGAIRVRKFAKYLCENGWRPVVLTDAMPRSHVAPGHPIDLETLGDVPPGLPVHRLPAWLDDWPRHLARSAAKWFRKGGGLVGRDGRELREGIEWRLKRLRRQICLPDPGVWRILPAVRAALRLHRRYHFDAIFTSGMPFSDHLCGLMLRLLIRRPWLADFRDPWAEYVHSPQWRGALGKHWTRAAEAAVVRAAACVISVNEHMTARFAARYARQPRGKFLTIPNGYDPADFTASSIPCGDASAPAFTALRVFRVLYAGSLYGARSPAILLEAFARFQRTLSADGRPATLDFIGRPGPYQAMIDEAARGIPVRHLGLLPQAQALRSMAAADLNIVLLPNVPGSDSDSTAKIYECLGSGRPLLAAVPPNGAAARLLARFDGVSICDPDDPAAIAAAMGRWHERWSRHDVVLSRPESQTQPLTRRYQAKQLAAILDRAASGVAAG